MHLWLGKQRPTTKNKERYVLGLANCSWKFSKLETFPQLFSISSIKGKTNHGICSFQRSVENDAIIQSVTQAEKILGLPTKLNLRRSVYKFILSTTGLLN